MVLFRQESTTEELYPFYNYRAWVNCDSIQQDKC